MGCREGRSSAEWVDFDFYGHQIVAHLAPGEVRPAARNAVDGDQVPVRHFGVILDMASWRDLADRLASTHDPRFPANVTMGIGPSWEYVEGT